MAKMVGLSRNLKLSWLDLAEKLSSEDLAEEEIKGRLNEYLSFEIESPTNLRKTREILLYIWYYENEHSEKLRPEAHRLIEKYPEYALEIHWCMMLAAYPVFVDLCKLIGKLVDFQTDLTLSQIKQKLFDEWGERTTLYHSIDKLIATLKVFDVLACDKPGKYHINKHTVKNEEVCSFMLYAIMNIDDGGYYSLHELRELDYLFPFDYKIEKEDVLKDEKFVVSNLGGELSIGLKS